MHDRQIKAVHMAQSLNAAAICGKQTPQRRPATREAALEAREQDFEKACARMQQGKDSYVVELEEELAATRSRLQATEAHLARFRRERTDVTQRLASTQSWLQDAESKAAQLSDQVRHHEKAASARTESQRRQRRHNDKRTCALGAFVQVLFDLLESNDRVVGKVGDTAGHPHEPITHSVYVC